ncbi:hypothetical protein [Lacimonas salitolerans]|uniref:Uncharacterized protein n=1 Tax=Lacimonas salitolerans TaxID=1323750 RepID=A0ABW4EKL4_9RHOB
MTVDALELTQLAELNLIGGAFTAENLLPQPEVAEAGMEFDVDTDKVVLRSPLAARTIVDLETTTLAAPYVGPYRVTPDIDVSFETFELTFDFGFTGNDWEAITLEKMDLRIGLSGPGLGTENYPLPIGIETRTVFETDEAFYLQFIPEHVTGYRIENGKFVVSLNETLYSSAFGLDVEELYVSSGSDVVQVRDGELLPTVSRKSSLSGTFSIFQLAP